MSGRGRTKLNTSRVEPKEEEDEIGLPRQDGKEGIRRVTQAICDGARKCARSANDVSVAMSFCEIMDQGTAPGALRADLHVNLTIRTSLPLW